MDQPSFSIVIPTFNRRDVVCDAVRALCRLDYDGPVELTVVVDGSTDGTAAALRALACPFPCRIIEQENAGAASARNRGAREASGDILLFLDDDMMAAQDLLRQHANSHREGADAVLGHIPLDPASPPGFLAKGVGEWAEQRATRLRNSKTLGFFDLLTGQLSVKRSVFAELGGFDERFTANGSFGDEDVDFGTRLLERHKVVFNAGAVTRQRYVVTSRDHLRQWKDAGRADVRFARKHPSHAQELFELHGSKRVATRLLIRPIATSGALSRAVFSVALSAAEREGRFSPQVFRFARDIAYWSGVREAGGIPSSTKVLVLCHHAIADLADDPVIADYGVEPDAFARHLDDLSARGFTFIAPDELLALLDGKGCVPRRAVLLTFDDCYEELVEVARRILEPRKIPAIAFAVTRTTSGMNEWDQAIGARKLRLLGAEGLRKLARHGVEIGCHSRSHQALGKLDEPTLAEETASAADDLTALDLPRPRFFAYPYGEHERRTRLAVASAGFKAAFALLPRHASRQGDRFAIPRLEILARDKGWRFRLKTRWPRLAPLTDLKSSFPAIAYRAAIRRLSSRSRRASGPATR